MVKKALRAEYKKLRNKLSDNEIDQKSKAIVSQIDKHIDLNNKVVSIFLPIHKHKEINTYYLLDYLKEKNAQITAPKSDFKTVSLSHIIIDEKTHIKESSFGIPEPEAGSLIPANQHDIVFVPLLAVNKKGFRVGYGKGFYDRFLSQCKSSCLFVGLHLFDSFEEIADIHEGDIPLHLIISPNKITYCERN